MALVLQCKLNCDVTIKLHFPLHLIASNPARDRMGGEKTTVETVYGISYRKEVVNEQLYTTVYQLFL